MTVPTTFTLLMLIGFFAVLDQLDGMPLWQRALLLPLVGSA